jgi:hypothetical protein
MAENDTVVVRPGPRRWLTLLLTLVFSLGASLPCASTRDFASELGHLTAAPGNPDEPPCHPHAAPTALKAPCPCGCEEHPPGATSLGSLGVALLQRSDSVPSALGTSRLGSRQRAWPRAPARAIEKVPRTA